MKIRVKDYGQTFYVYEPRSANPRITLNGSDVTGLLPTDTATRVRLKAIRKIGREQDLELRERLDRSC